MQFHYFVDTTDLRLKERIGCERRPKDRVPLWISLWAHVFPTFFIGLLKIMFLANLLCMYGNKMHKTLDLGFFSPLH